MLLLGAMEEEAAEVPPFFTCPISLQIMRDPVTLPTGITYDRESIELWVSSTNNPTCPVSKQPLQAADIDGHGPPQLTPNNMLRKLIEDWVAENSLERCVVGARVMTTPRGAGEASAGELSKLLQEARVEPGSRTRCLRELSQLFAGGERDRRLAVEAGAAEFLVSIVSESKTDVNRAESDTALSVLQALSLSEEGLRELVAENPAFIDTLTSVLRHAGNHQSRTNSVLLMKSIFEATSPVRLAAVSDDLFAGVVSVLLLQERPKYSLRRATMASLQVLKELVPWGRNRVKACGAGAVPALVELLLLHIDDRGTGHREAALTVLEQLCRCAEGRQALLGHGAGVAAVGACVGAPACRGAASDRAVRVVNRVARCSATPAFLAEMAEAGVVGRLCYVAEAERGSRASEKAKEVLRLHYMSWRDSPCIPPLLLYSYPTS